MRAFRFALLISTVLWATVSPASTQTFAEPAKVSAEDSDPLLISATVSPTDWSPGQAGQLKIDLRLPDGFHAYEDQFQLTLLEPDGFLLGPFKLDPVVEFFDKFSKKNRKGIKNSATMTAGLEAPSRFPRDQSRLRLELVYQACSETFCLFPITRVVDVPVTLIGAPKAGAPSVAGSDIPVSVLDFLNEEKLGRLLNQSLPLALFFVFLAGILTSFTPCIFPMIPITLAILGHESEKRSRAQNFVLSLSYVHGIATTYSLLGVIAASSGALFGASLGNPWVLGFICAIFLLMALGMYGLYELQVPAIIRNRLGAKKTTTGIFGAYVSGLIAGIVASPCVGPVLVAILAWVATTQNKALGFILLFTYAMGLGLIFLFLGVFTELTRKLPRSGPWLDTVKFILGSLMLGAFYYYLSLLVPERWHDLALGLGLVVLGSAAGAFGPLRGPKMYQHIRKGLAQATLVLGFGYLALGAFDLRPALHANLFDPTVSKSAGGAAWSDYSDQALAKAETSGRPVIIDFWAEWCAACHELEQFTFRDPRVALRLKSFELLRYDATKDTPELRSLKEKWRIQGLPTVLILDSQGRWRQDLTLTQFERADLFLERISGL